MVHTAQGFLPESEAKAKGLKPSKLSGTEFRRLLRKPRGDLGHLYNLLGQRQRIGGIGCIDERTSALQQSFGIGSGRINGENTRHDVAAAGGVFGEAGAHDVRGRQHINRSQADRTWIED